MATKKTQELAVVPEEFQIQTISNMLPPEEIAEELDGLGSVLFDRVKIPSGGGISFKIPDPEDDDKMISSDELVGVIAYHHPMNAYWENDYNGGNTPPDCSSLNGKVGIRTETGECIDCSKCVYNQYGSAKKGEGKACKNVHRCFIIRDNNPVPLILTLPPTSLAGLRNYIAKKLMFKGLKTDYVITRIKLKTDKNAGGIEYSKATFENAGKLSEEQIKQVLNMKELIKNLVGENSIDLILPITSDDYNTEVEDSTAVPALEATTKPEEIKESKENSAESLVKNGFNASEQQDPFYMLDFDEVPDDGNPFG